MTLFLPKIGISKLNIETLNGEKKSFIKNVQISFDRFFAKNLQFFRNTCAIRFFMSKAFQKAKFYQNLTSGRGSKQRFSLLQEKAVIQAVCLRTQAVSIKARF